MPQGQSKVPQSQKRPRRQDERDLFSGTGEGVPLSTTVDKWKENALGEHASLENVAEGWGLLVGPFQNLGPEVRRTNTVRKTVDLYPRDALSRQLSEE